MKHMEFKYKNIKNLIKVTIPINKGIESLNVSNACAVSLYHLDCEKHIQVNIIYIMRQIIFIINQPSVK